MPALAAIALLLAAIAANGAPICEDKACAWPAALAHPIRRIEAWTGALTLPVEKRLGPASPALIEYLTLDNIAQGFPERPRPASLPADFLADVNAAIEELPAPVKRALSKDFGGLYFVESLGGTGYTDYIRDGKRIVGAYVVLDATVLMKRSANEWATWKENTPFTPDATHALRAKIEASAQDSRRNAIQYILLHELGHVMSAAADVHPSWGLRPKDVLMTEEYPYFQLSWRVDRTKDRYVSIFDGDFGERTQIVYYIGAKLRAADMASVYGKLEATNFPTLYAATNPGDDFAEAFANYVHVVLMKRPFEVEILDGGRSVRTYGPCWEEARCAAKRRILEKLLGLP